VRRAAWAPLALLAALLCCSATALAQEGEGPSYAVQASVKTLPLADLPGVVRLDCPGRPRGSGSAPDEVAQVAPLGGRVMLVSERWGRLYRPGVAKPLWSGRVDGVWTLSPDGRKLAVATHGGVTLTDLEHPRRTRWFAAAGTPRPLFSRDSRRLLIIDEQLELITHRLDKHAPPSRARLFRGGAMLDYAYLFPDGRTLFFTLLRTAGNGSTYCRDLPTGRTGLVTAFSGVDWSARYRVSWNGQFVWSSARLPDSRLLETVALVTGLGVRGESDAPIVLSPLASFDSQRTVPAVASVGNATTYAYRDRLELFDLVERVVTRIEGWPVAAGGDSPTPIGFLEPQKQLAVLVGTSIYLLPVGMRAPSPPAGGMP